MKIALVAPLVEAVPPKLYGGTERVVSYLAEALVALGHDVTLFAASDSCTSAKLVSVQPALRLAHHVIDQDAPFIAMSELLAQRAHEFDIISLHNGFWSVPLLKRLGVPFVVTIHNRADFPEVSQMYAILGGDVPVIAISASQKRLFPKANCVGVVHHGLPIDLLKLGSGAGGYLATLGRFSPDKGCDAAIRIATQANMTLKIAAKVLSDTDEEIEYYHNTIEPLLALPNIQYVGEVNEAQKQKFLGDATALLFPIRWEEPFGLAMIEAMASGTPVVATPYGSVPEIVEDGVTGYIVGTEEEAVRTVLEKIPKMDRKLVRERGLKKFNSRRMAQDYVDIFRKLIGKDGRVSGHVEEDSLRPCEDSLPVHYLKG